MSVQFTYRSLSHLLPLFTQCFFYIQKWGTKMRLAMILTWEVKWSPNSQLSTSGLLLHFAPPCGRSSGPLVPQMHKRLLFPSGRLKQGRPQHAVTWHKYGATPAYPLKLDRSPLVNRVSSFQCLLMAWHYSSCRCRAALFPFCFSSRTFHSQGRINGRQRKRVLAEVWQDLERSGMFEEFLFITPH